MISEKSFLSGYLHRDRNLHSKFHISSSSSFGCAMICQSVSQFLLLYIYHILHGCETWSLTLRQEHRLREFQIKVLTKIFGFKRDKIMGEWRTLYNAALHAFYSSPNIIFV